MAKKNHKMIALTPKQPQVATVKGSALSSAGFLPPSWRCGAHAHKCVKRLKTRATQVQKALKDQA